MSDGAPWAGALRRRLFVHLDVGSTEGMRRAMAPVAPKHAAPPRPSSPSFVRAHITLVRMRALGGEHMQLGEEPKVDDAIEEIAALLAAAYERRAKIRLVHTTPEPLPSTEGLDNTGETSPHELKLTGRRKESTRQ